MAKAEFSLKQRVNVPGFSGVQGVVSAVSESTKRPAIYDVDWVTSDGYRATAQLSEADLLVANPG